MYGKPIAYTRPIIDCDGAPRFDGPSLTQSRECTLSASSPGALQDLLSSPQGQWNNCVVTGALPAAWSAVVLELWGRTGGAWVVLGRAVPSLRAGAIVGAPAAATQVTLIQAAARPCDAYTLRARTTGAELGGAELSLMCWGSDAVLPMEPQRVLVANGAAFALSVAVARPCMVRSVYGTLNPAAGGQRFIWLMDSNNAGVTPPTVSAIPVNPGNVWSWNPALGDPFSSGLLIGVSTTFNAWVPSADTTTATAYID